MLDRLKQWASGLRREVLALWLSARDPRVPWYAKALCLVIVAYALSPIDLIPDFIPIVGYLDELVLLPLLILLAVRLVPPALMSEFRIEAERMMSRPTSRAGAAAIIAIWLGAAAWLIWLFWPSALAG